ncbi:MAG: ankyrin repeat domain-containing protein [Bryobacteraceae bacterium]
MNLDQQKKQARELLRGIRSGDVDALARLRSQATRFTDVDDATIRQQAALHDAQFVLAREQGFASWPKLKLYAEPSHVARHSRLYVADMQWIAQRVRGLVRTRGSAGPAAIEQIREWHPRFAEATDQEIVRAPFSEDDACLVYAREHGFETWGELAARVRAVAANKSTEPFLLAFEILQAGDTDALTSLLRAHPGLARERGTNGNSLLSLAVSLYGKPGSGRDTDAVAALIAAGAEVDDVNDRGWTALHQAAYYNQPTFAAVLISHGSATDAEAHGSGGTPLVAALFWGHREVADLLSTHGVVPNNLRTAAGLGVPELVDACFNNDGILTPEACAARGFYRPHSGFPSWRPSHDPQEVLDEALVWACKSNRVGVLDRLVRAGARVDADPYRGTPLIWAAACNRLDAADWLLDHGADVNQKATFGGESHGQGITALHIAAQYGYLGIVKLLVERGADISIKEDLYQATAAGAAEYFGQTGVRDYLASLKK